MDLQVHLPGICRTAQYSIFFQKSSRDLQLCSIDNYNASFNLVFLFPVESSVDLLKFQASKASCPVDLLAAESLARRLITICNSSEQLLSKNQLVML